MGILLVFQKNPFYIEPHRIIIKNNSNLTFNYYNKNLLIKNIVKINDEIDYWYFEWCI